MLRKILKTILLGREDGFRQKIFSGTTVDTSPNASFSSPIETETKPQQNLEAPKGVTPPDGFEVVAHVDALEEGMMKEIIIAGTAIVLTKQDGEIFAFENDCPHAGGPLSEGQCDSGQILCPYHGWAFDLKSGECLTNSEFSIERYEVCIEDTAICVKL